MKQIMLDLDKGYYKELKKNAMNREEWMNISLMNPRIGKKKKNLDR